MDEVIVAAHKVYELTTSDVTVLMITAFGCGALISDGFAMLVKWIIKMVRKSPA